jgi:hypothetical protein
MSPATSKREGAGSTTEVVAGGARGHALGSRVGGVGRVGVGWEGIRGAAVVVGVFWTLQARTTQRFPKEHTRAHKCTPFRKRRRRG